MAFCRIGSVQRRIAATVLGGTTVTISHTRRAGVTFLLAGAAFLLAPVPAHAATCPAGQHWNEMGGGSGFCSPNASGGGTGGTGSVDLGGSNVPAPQAPAVPAPPAYKAPVYAPAPVQAPAPTYEAPAPVQAPAYQAPAPVQAPAPAYQAPANNNVAPKTGSGYQAPAQAPVPGAVPQYGPATGADTGVPAGTAPTEAPVEAAPAPSATPEAVAVAATPPAIPSPTPTASVSPEPATVSTDQAFSAEVFNPAPLFIIGGVMLAAALTWFVRPIRAAVSRIVTRSRP